MPRSQVFLLSPAYCGGRRATYLLRPGSQLALAQQLVAGTLTLGDAFAFMSGLYFRGKLAYARHFGRIGQAGRVEQVGQVGHVERFTSPTCPPCLVITPTRGLQSPDSIVTADALREFAAVDVNADDARYRQPLDRDLKRLARTLPPETRVVLLGSIATGKYLDALTAALGHRLYYPEAFVGRGDMSRGGLMLRCIAANAELDYTPLTLGASRHGARPPKLPPLPKPTPAARYPPPVARTTTAEKT